MDERRKTKEYVKHIVKTAHVLTKDISKKQESREFIRRNVEREWRHMRSGIKSVEEVRKDVVDIFYTVFPTYRLNNFLPSFEEFTSDRERIPNASKSNEDIENSQGEVDQSSNVDIPLAADNEKHGRPRKTENSCRKKSVNEAQEDEKQPLINSCSKQIERRATSRKTRKRKLDDIVQKKTNVDTSEEVIRVDSSCCMEYQDVKRCLKGRLLQDVVEAVINKNGLRDCDKNAISFIDTAVRIRLESILEDLKMLSALRRKRNRKDLMVRGVDRVNALLEVERETEEIHLLRLRDERMATRRFDMKNAHRLRLCSTEEEEVGDLEIVKVHNSDDEKHGAEKQTKQKMNQKRMFLQNYVTEKAKKRRKISRVLHVSDIEAGKESTKRTSFAHDNKERRRNLAREIKLLELPAIISSANLAQLRSLKMFGKFDKTLKHFKESITLYDCDLLMEFDPHLRKSNLRLRWISRLSFAQP